MVDPQTNNLEHLLAKLGEAHDGGAFKADASGHPWRTADGRKQLSGHRHHRWLWMGTPVAAAAAVAGLFVGPRFFPEEVAESISESVSTRLLPERPEALAEAVPTSTRSIECRDFNGDGVVNGADIQGFVNSHRKAGGDPEEVQAFIDRCLMGG